MLSLLRKRWLRRMCALLGILAAMLVRPDPGLAQVENGISAPESGAEIGGIVEVVGTAVDPNFLRYEVAFRPVGGGDWIVFAQGDQPVSEGTLAVWDTTVGRETAPVFPDGRYELRLRVVRQDYNYDEYYVSDITVANESVTPTPEASATLTADERATSPQARGTAEAADVGPAVLPTLTPFPTPSPEATSVAVPLGPGESGSQSESGGLAERLNSLDLNRLSDAFWSGVAIAAAAFAGLGLYLALRALVRRLRRRLRGGRLL
ncbi:MAG: hypothetical protein R3300_09820 [Candidatus Promineifilaceae bacterium]|nr:hypothetical protein [Candidatus Promineifilaceae bacterium]